MVSVIINQSTGQILQICEDTSTANQEKARRIRAYQAGCAEVGIACSEVMLTVLERSVMHAQEKAD